MKYLVSITNKSVSTIIVTDDNMSVKVNEVLMGESDYHYFCSNAKYATINNSVITYDLKKVEKAEEYVSPNQFVLDRIKEYPYIGDQLDAIWKVLDPPEGTDAFHIKQTIQAIKTRHPKPITGAKK